MGGLWHCFTHILWVVWFLGDHGDHPTAPLRWAAGSGGPAGSRGTTEGGWETTHGGQRDVPMAAFRWLAVHQRRCGIYMSIYVYMYTVTYVYQFVIERDISWLLVWCQYIQSCSFIYMNIWICTMHTYMYIYMYIIYYRRMESFARAQELKMGLDNISAFAKLQDISDRERLGPRMTTIEPFANFIRANFCW